MSNFQRTRSKVWWGDSPPNIGSPVAGRMGRGGAGAAAGDWEPQLPHWVRPRGGEDEGEEEVEEEGDAEARHPSPGSHKSQDSGFSDSDTSPQAAGQVPTPPLAASACKHKMEDQEDRNTPPKRDLNHGALEYVQTPKSTYKNYRPEVTPLRSLIKTPKDLQNYLEAHCDLGHGDEEVDFHREATKSAFDVIVTPQKNINNNDIVFNEKYSKKRNLLETFNAHTEEVHNSLNNVELVRVSSSDSIRVNNRPRVRSPVTRINYHPPVHFVATEKPSFILVSKSDEKNNNNENEENICGSTHYFQRRGLNRSLHYSYQRVDEQILDEGSHSLGYIEVMKEQDERDGVKEFSSRKITDSLNLKIPKKSTVKTKQKIQHKASKTKQNSKNNKGFFHFLPKRNESIKTIFDITNGSGEIDRVPSLGLPRSHRQIDLSVRNDESEDEVMDNYKENSADDVIQNSSSSNGILKSPTTTRKITPPLQFQDGQKTFKQGNGLLDNRESSIWMTSSKEEINFCEQELSSACTSTPKTFLSDDIQRSMCESQRYRCSALQQAPPCVESWLGWLSSHCEPECPTTLQSKALGPPHAASLAPAAHTITANIRKVQMHGQIIYHQFNQLIQDLQNKGENLVKATCDEITDMTASMKEFILTHSITLKIKPPRESPERWNKISSALETNIQKVMEVTEDINLELNEAHPEINVLYNHLNTLLDIFIETVRAVLVQQMRTLVNILEEPPSDLILKSTLTSLGLLGASNIASVVGSDERKEVTLVSSLPLVECGVVRALLSLIIENPKNSVKALSLRALATICVSSDAVKQFEEAGGIEIISDILCDGMSPEPQLREAVTVLTQVTGPWLQGDYQLIQLDTHMDIIIQHITEILCKTCCCQLLLLCTACLVNLVNIVKKKERQKPGTAVDIIQMLNNHNTIEKLLNAVKMKGPGASVFLQEQTATLINLVSSSSRGRDLLSHCRAMSVALVCFLRCPRSSPPLPQPAQHQAEFRLFTHTAEALARMCCVPEVTAQVVQVEGVARLVRAIMGVHGERGSDHALANCLRALRSVITLYPDCVKDLEYDITDMIKPTLMESVKIYSAKQESYV